MADPDALIGQTVSHYRIIRVGSASRRMELYAAKYPGKYFVFDCSERNTIADSDLLRSVNGTASKCKTFLATATEECCPARGTLAGHFTRRLSPSPMPGKKIRQQRAYLPLKRKQSAPAILSRDRRKIGCWDEHGHTSARSRTAQGSPGATASRGLARRASGVTCGRVGARAQRCSRRDRSTFLGLVFVPSRCARCQRAIRGRFGSRQDRWRRRARNLRAPRSTRCRFRWPGRSRVYIPWREERRLRLCL